MVVKCINFPVLSLQPPENTRIEQAFLTDEQSLHRQVRLVKPALSYEADLLQMARTHRTNYSTLAYSVLESSVMT